MLNYYFVADVYNMIYYYLSLPHTEFYSWRQRSSMAYLEFVGSVLSATAGATFEKTRVNQPRHALHGTCVMQSGK